MHSAPVQPARLSRVRQQFIKPPRRAASGDRSAKPLASGKGLIGSGKKLL